MNSLPRKHGLAQTTLQMGPETFLGKCHELQNYMFAVLLGGGSDGTKGTRSASYGRAIITSSSCHVLPVKLSYTVKCIMLLCSKEILNKKKRKRMQDHLATQNKLTTTLTATQLDVRIAVMSCVPPFITQLIKDKKKG
jgi:hypothetical protein